MSEISNDCNGPYEIGKNYFIRTVTMASIGKLIEVYENELVLCESCWVASTGRFHNFLREGLQDSTEIEPFVDIQVIGRNSIIDCTPWRHKLPDAQV